MLEERLDREISEAKIQMLYEAYRTGYRALAPRSDSIPNAAGFVGFLESRHPDLVPYYNLKVIAEVM